MVFRIAIFTKYYCVTAITKSIASNAEKADFNQYNSQRGYTVR